MQVKTLTVSLAEEKNNSLQVLKLNIPFNLFSELLLPVAWTVISLTKTIKINIFIYNFTKTIIYQFRPLEDLYYNLLY